MTSLIIQLHFVENNKHVKRVLTKPVGSTVRNKLLSPRIQPKAARRLHTQAKQTGKNWFNPGGTWLGVLHWGLGALP